MNEAGTLPRQMLEVRELTADTGVEAVSQIALDTTWSALRFRPIR